MCLYVCACVRVYANAAETAGETDHKRQSFACLPRAGVFMREITVYQVRHARVAYRIIRHETPRRNGDNSFAG